MAWFKSKKDEEKKETPEEQPAPAVAVPHKGDSQSYQIIRGPHVTEKASTMAGDGKYVFRVGSDAGKLEIRRSIEKLYKVKVSHVHILRMPSKFRQVGRHQGERSGYKKAIVTLRKGEKIDIN